MMANLYDRSLGGGGSSGAGGGSGSSNGSGKGGGGCGSGNGCDDEGPSNDSEVNIGLDVIQSMIDISADRLEGLRTQCATSAELTQQEIRTLETKLVKLFSDLLITKSKLPERLPSRGLPATGNELKQWLRVVGLSCASLNAVIQQVSTLEGLLVKDEKELRAIMENNVHVREEEIKRLIRAVGNLKRFREQLEQGSSDLKEPMYLYWDSWDRHPVCYRTSPRVNRSGGKAGKLSQAYCRQNGDIAAPQQTLHQQSPDESMTISGNSAEALLHPSSNQMCSPDDLSSVGMITPSPSPPNSPSTAMLHNKQNKKGTFPTTPPPKKKHQTLLSSNQPQITTTQIATLPLNSSSSTFSSIGDAGNQTLPKSKSHELQQFVQNIPATVASADGSLQSSAVLAAGCQQPSSGSLLSCSIGGSALGVATGGSNSMLVDGTGAALKKPIARNRLHTEPSGGIAADRPTGDVSMTSDGMLISAPPPKSPCTPIIKRCMGHSIQHRFITRFKFKMTKSTCDLCDKQMFFGFKCTECKYRCHKDCKSKVPPSCGLPEAFVEEFKKTLHSDDMPAPTASPNIGRNFPRDKPRSIHGHDSSSAGSSCNSSSPSSPALLSLPPQTPATAKNQFNFPEIANGIGGCDKLLAGITIETHPIMNSYKTLSHHHHGGNISGTADNLGDIVAVPKLQFSEIADKSQSSECDKTGSTSATSTDSSSDRTPIRLDSTEEREHENWPRQNSLSLKEWDIPYDDLDLLEKIGNGRFGTVHRALWHGDVAVKLLKEDYVADERTLEAFKLEVATFKKTRHENVVLFMGACMKPPRLAIITSLCKGKTLFTHIHLRKDKFNLNRTTLVAQQVSQGMGYLHARGIVHKDLKTKNIFLENGKVIITDFGLFSATKLFYCDHGLGIPGGWLCYLAPELIRNLTPYRPVEGDLPFSRASDLYAFGTVWYELLCGEFPFKSQPPESIIWQVGRGMKQTLANLQASRDVKDILMRCWNFHPDDRQDFAKLLRLLERLPKKRLARSPSHPVQLSRSAESVF